MRTFRLCSLPAVLALFLSSAIARPSFLDLIPNGFAHERSDSGIICQYLGHQQCIPGEARNPFGNDFEAQEFQWTKELCETDSDGDGLTNGQELGDPCCVWTQENAGSVKLRLTELSHPGDSSKTNTAPTGCPDTATVAPTPSSSSSTFPLEIPASSSPTSSPVTAPTKTPTPTASMTPATSISVTSSPTVSLMPPSDTFEDEVDDEASALMSPDLTPSPEPEEESLPPSMPPSMPASTSMSTSASASVSMTVTPSITPIPVESVDPLVSVEAEVTPDPNDPVCFPAHASVTLTDGQQRRMDEIKIGDEVLVGPGVYSRVFMMSHADSGVGPDRSGTYEFLTLELSSGASLSLTKGHYLYILFKENGKEKLVRADSARVGDSVITVLQPQTSGSRIMDQIVNIETHRFQGLFNPQTLDGDIVVNGVKVSTYTTAIYAPTAHSLLAPLRALFRTLGWSTTAFESNGRGWLQILPRGHAEL